MVLPLNVSADVNERPPDGEIVTVALFTERLVSESPPSTSVLPFETDVPALRNVPTMLT